jgi:hypothetical protein
MNKRNWLVSVRMFGSLGLLAVALVCVYAFTGTPIATAGPVPDCGPTFSWDCKMPDGSHQCVEGTRCEIGAFQRQTGAVCKIASC